MPSGVGVQALANRSIRGALHGCVQHGIDAQAALVHRLGSVSALQVLANLLEEVRRQVIARVLQVQGKRLLHGLLRFAHADAPVVVHALDHQVAPRQRALVVEHRRIDRPADQGGKQRRLGQLELARRLAEIELRCGLEAVVAVRQVDLVAVHGEDLLLGVAPLDLDGQQGFLHLAPEAFVGREKEHAGELHGECAGALGFAALHDVAPGRLSHPREVNAPVLFEVLVFGYQDGVLQHLRHLVVSDQDAPLEGEAAHQLPVVGVELGDHVGPVVFQRADLRQIAGVNK